MRNSASGMFVQCNLLSFGELLRKSIFAFRGRIQSSNNAIIKRPAAVVEWLALRTPNHVDAAASGRSRVQSPAGAL